MPIGQSGGSLVTGANIVDGSISAADIDIESLAGVGVAEFVDTQVYSAGPPTSFTDLDLSAVVGAAAKMVLLQVRKSGATASSQTYSFRTNGSTIDANMAGNGGAGGAGGAAILSNGTGAYVLVKTDTAGVIEWRSDQGNDTAIITVQAYW